MVATNMEMNRSGFNEHDEKWHCCCYMHCKSGAYIIGLLSCVLGGLSLVPSLVFIAAGVGAPGVLNAVITIICGVLIVLAVKDERPGFLLPALILLGFTIAVILLVSAVFIILSIAAIVLGANIKAWLSSTDIDMYSWEQRMNGQQATVVTTCKWCIVCEYSDTFEPNCVITFSKFFTVQNGFFSFAIVMIVLSVFMMLYSIIYIWFFRVLSKFRRFLKEKESQPVHVMAQQLTAGASGGHDYPPKYSAVKTADDGGRRSQTMPTKYRSN